MARHDPRSEQPTAPRPRAQLPVAYPFVITVVDGIDAGNRCVVDADAPPLFVGKSEVCQLRLRDPMVSRRHASFEVVDDRLRLRDLASTNGTYMPGAAVVEVYVMGTAEVRMGGSTLRIERGAPEPARLTSATRFGTLIGASPVMRRLYPLCQRLAGSDVPVVIEGATGVGKEQLAESLHLMGPRRDQPFVVFDCTAVAPTLIESELFGHEKGAFTGSHNAHAGVFERSHGGTLLIDEIGDLPPALQPRLLRAIERRTIQRVGGEAHIQVDVRVIAATRRDLDREVQLGRFRDDLFHRLAVARIELPPLRDRHGDVELLARHFWSELGGDPGSIPDDLLSSWADDPWPGNVRQLRNAVTRRLALGDLAGEQPIPDEGVLHAALHSGDAIGGILALDLPLPEARQRLMNEFEQRYVQRQLEIHQGNVTRAAAAAGVARRHMQRLKARLGRDEP
ncbi:MAG TPA: sigma 54-interacting transcriptional regulator [Polyangiaceae bacterium]|nr:sigma 54-interacting transcriptional regulator [Polyangiaceae bacterium]